MNNSWKEYFIFSKKERIAIAILIILIAAFIALPFLYSPDKQKPVEDKNLEQQIATLQSNKKSTTNNITADDSEDVNQQLYHSSQNIEAPRISLFYFDPNTLNADGWKRLGINNRTIHTIQNYLSKSGSFKKPEDIRKIYGLKKDDADRLIPYVQIQSRQAFQNTSKNLFDTFHQQKVSVNNFSSSKKYQVIEINTAPVEEWKALPGIGDVLGNRIVKFRNKIGGFTSIDEVKKTYGLSDSTFQIIRPYLTIDSSSH
ncbi:MAG: helix-hairpin-helix domain-containing protein [Chitinophagaceae bacterium]